ncbi:MAG: cell division protein SepF [Clostridia bacterium]|nr:cell division protein SepF [Clostridia bacterium]
MAEVFSRFKNFLGFGSGNTAPDTDEYFDEDVDEKASIADSEDEYTVITKDRYSRVGTAASANYGTRSSVREAQPEKRAEHTEKSAQSGERTGKVISMGVNSNLRVVLSKPASFENCEAICSHLRGQMTVVLNLEFVPEVNDRRRIFDFVSGCCYALDCSIQRVSDLIYVIAPSNVDVLAEVTDEEDGAAAYSAF